MKKIFKKLSTVAAIAVVAFAGTGCQDYLQASSSTDVTDEVALSNTNNIEMLLRGVYKGIFVGGNVASADRIQNGMTGLMSWYDVAGVDITSAGGLGGGEHTGYSFAPGRTQSSDLNTRVIWTQYYDHINRCNIIIDALPAATGPDADKAYITGQAKALRAISYFTLVMNYQQTYAIAKNKRGVILRLKANDPASMPFSTVEQVYAQIIKDFTEAKTALAGFNPGNVWQITPEIVNAWLARVYQVKGDWTNAYSCANEVYKNHTTLLTKEQWYTGFDDFIRNGYNELVWGYTNTEKTSASYNTMYNMWHNSDPSLGEGNSPCIYSFMAYYATHQYVNLFDDQDWRGARLETTLEQHKAGGLTAEQEVNDANIQKVMFWHRVNSAAENRAHKWAYNKFKHYGESGNMRADICLIRSAEMLLIMAEAKAYSNTGEALTLLNTLQRARNVKNLTTTTVKEDLLEAIYIERRKELLGEGVTGMYDANRLQKDLTREVADASNNDAGHFVDGLGYWGTKSSDGKTSTLKHNDYKYFLQIPDYEFARNTEIQGTEGQNQNPFEGK